MSSGKHLSLEEALKENDLKRFAKAHPSTGDKDLFDRLFNAMAKKTSSSDETSTADDDAC